MLKFIIIVVRVAIIIFNTDAKIIIELLVLEKS